MPDRCPIIPRPAAGARQESPDRHRCDGRSRLRDGEVPVMTAGAWWTELLVCPRLQRGAFLRWGRHSCLPVARERGGILAPAERAALLGEVQRVWAGSGDVNATARRPGQTRMSVPPHW